MQDYAFINQYIGQPPSMERTTKDVGQPTGKMPDEMLLAKFDYTDDGDYLGTYSDYARGILKDRRPDRATMEYEEPRKSTQNAGVLNVLHYGGRGKLNSPAHPEINTELTDREPRRTFTDPDMREMRRQGEARTRFVRMDSGNADTSVTGGGLRENQVMDIKQTTFRMTRPRMMWFTTSKDGRRTGMRRDYEHKSLKTAMDNPDIVSNRYGDAIRDFALNPQRKTDILSNDIIRNTSWYHQNTTDHEFAVAKYGQDARRKRLDTRENKVATYDGDSSRVRTCAEDSQQRKAAGILMANIVMQKHFTEQDTEHKNSKESFTAKSAAPKDMQIVQQLTQADTTYTDTDSGMLKKSKNQELQAHGKLTTRQEGVTPAHVKLDAELMFKAVRQTGDFNKIQQQVHTDDKAPKPEDDTQARKRVIESTRGGSAPTYIETGDTTRATHIYKTPQQTRGDGITPVDPEKFGDDADDTKTGKTKAVNHRNPNSDDTAQDTGMPTFGTINTFGGRSRAGKKTIRYGSDDIARGNNFEASDA